MSDLTIITLAFAGAGLTISLGVWLLVRTKLGADRADPEQSDSGGDSSSERGSMQVNDWVNAAVNVVIGVLLGIAIVRLGQLITTAFWPVVVLIPILIGGFLLFDGLIDRLFDKVFPSGIRAARKSPARRRAPLPRLLSLPVGIVLGVALDWLGFGDRLLGII